MLRRVLKLLFSLVAVLGLVLTAGSLLLPSEFSVQRSVTVAAAPEAVWPLLAEPRRWPSWTAWNRRDPSMQLQFEGPASGAGAAWSWRSASEGDGRMVFTAADAPRQLRYELRFGDDDTPSRGELRLEPAAGGTRVSWSMTGRMGANPMFKWMALFADRFIGPDFEAGLAQLKALVEAR